MGVFIFVCIWFWLCVKDKDLTNLLDHKCVFEFVSVELGKVRPTSGLEGQHTSWMIRSYRRKTKDKQMNKSEKEEMNSPSFDKKH